MELNPKKTYKSRQKLWLNYIKENSKEYKFKFNSNFIYKLENEIIYSSSFNVSLIENKISGYLHLLPEGLSEIFWKITDSEENIDRSLSFRINAAFNVRPLIFYRFDLEIKNLDKYETEIDKLILT